MDQERKKQILAAEADFIDTERLCRALAENGVYVVGKLGRSSSPTRTKAMLDATGLDELD